MEITLEVTMDLRIKFSRVASLLDVRVREMQGEHSRMTSFFRLG